MNEKNTPKKEVKAKNLRYSKETLGIVQEYMQEDAWECMLHMLKDSVGRERLAYWTPLGKGKFGSLLEIRLKSIAPPVLQLQYKSRRNGSRLLSKNVKRNRAGSNGATTKRPTSKRKGVRLVRQTNVRLPTNFGQLKQS